MHQPPDTPVPPEEEPSGDLPDGQSPQSKGSSSGDEDTRPLKELQDRRGGPPQGTGEVGRTPPATVLHEALSAAPRRQPEPPWSPTAETDRVRLIPKAAEPLPWRVIFQAASPASTTIGLDVRQPLVVGRLDPDGDQNPDLDLTPHLAQAHGVSRRHALLIPEADGLYLADLESTNGTWVNGEYLDPGKRHILTPGDRIEFGLLRVVVKSVTPLSRTSRGS